MSKVGILKVKEVQKDVMEVQEALVQIKAGLVFFS